MRRCVVTTAAAVLLIRAIALAQSAPDFKTRLEEADRLAWLTNWYDALTLYEQVERAAAKAGDRRAAMYAKFGRLRGQMNTLPLAEISEQIATDLESPLAKQDARLRLRALTIKGDFDLEWDVQAAQHDWQQVQLLAKELGDKAWQNRAAGELGMIAFLMGNTGQASTLVQQALQGAIQHGDVGGQLRYVSAIANGLLLAGHPQLALGYVERALKLATEHPATGFPYPAQSTKVLILLALNQPDEAERFANAAMAEAHTRNHRIKEIELRLMLAQIAQKRGHRDPAMEHLHQAATMARVGHVQRLLADAEAALADAHRARRDLVQAQRHALAAVRATEAARSRFTLPTRLSVLAGVYAEQGRVAEADRIYEQAADVVEGIMVNVPSRDAQARLIGVMSDLYAGHFRLVAERLANPVRAYEVVERARGRALADVLRTVSDTERPPTDAVAQQMKVISRLQTRLMRVRAASDRKQILEELWDAEQQVRALRSEPRVTMPARHQTSIKTIQRSLRPNELILEYVLTEPGSYCLVIGAATLKLVPLSSRKQIEESVDSFVRDIRTRADGQSTSAQALYDAVLRPAINGQSARRLIIVPDGKLHLVPFDSLARTSSSEERVITIAPSVSVFHLLRTRSPRMNADRPLLAVGGVPYDRMFSGGQAKAAVTRSSDTRGLYDATFPSNLPPLATAQQEVLTAARLLGPSSVVLTGDGATESALKAADLWRFEILHFAVHAFADPKFPERAALVLLNDPAAAEDGLLQPREIGQLRLNAAIVVLSACDTSVGPTIGQEGVQNLARAFLLAGARSVITTLWAVSDAVSMALMRAFYDNITSGEDIGQALTRAKRAILDRFGPQALPTVSAFQIVGLGDHQVTTNVARKNATERPRQ